MDRVCVCMLVVYICRQYRPTICSIPSKKPNRSIKEKKFGKDSLSKVSLKVYYTCVHARVFPTNDARSRDVRHTRSHVTSGSAWRVVPQARVCFTRVGYKIFISLATSWLIIRSINCQGCLQRFIICLWYFNVSFRVDLEKFQIFGNILHFKKRYDLVCATTTPWEQPSCKIPLISLLNKIHQ